MDKWRKLKDCSKEVDLDNLILNIVDDDTVQEGAGKAIAFGVLAFLLGSA